jgi:hypothetical protein
MGAKQFGIQCIGINDEMLDYFGLSRSDVQDRLPPSNMNSHWKNVKKLAETTNPELKKEIPFVSKYRIEIDKVHAKVGSRRLFEYVLKKLAEHHRDLNRVIPPQDYVQPEVLGDLAREVIRIGTYAGSPEAYIIYDKQYDYEGLCDDVWKRQEENDDRVRLKIESNKHIKWASKQLGPIIERLSKVKTKKQK